MGITMKDDSAGRGSPGTTGDTHAWAPLLSRAVELANDNGSAGQLPFGALVVQGGTILGTGVNTALRDLDPTAHAEVAAIRDACTRLKALSLTGATVVSSCEPCAICHAVAAATGIDRIVYAAPKEYVRALGPPEPGRDPIAELMTSMQSALRTLAPHQIEYVATPGADEPFQRYLAARGAEGGANATNAEDQS
jgi:guanine deaminase